MRLIDADAIDRNTFVKAVGENGGFISFEDCLDMLKNQPTAYDVDGVIKGLERYRNFITIQARGFVQTAINIVKEGVKDGRND